MRRKRPIAIQRMTKGARRQGKTPATRDSILDGIVAPRAP
jgi:hypothetical protein